MKRTFPLNWQALVSRLQPSLPPTPRETRKLLALLSSSFKHRLDQVHPIGLGDDARSADNHLRSILASPLFVTRPAAPRSHASYTTRRSTTLPDMPLVKGPMDFFREKVAIGAADLELASLCLRAQLKSCLRRPAVDPARSLRDTGAGSIVLNWLWSSGQEESMAFLRHRSFTNLLISFLVAERRRDPVLSWMRRIYNDAGLQPEVKSTRLAQILHCLVKASILRGDGLSSAMRVYVDFFQETPSDKLTYRVFDRPARYIAASVAGYVPCTARQPIVDEDLFDAFFTAIGSYPGLSSFEYASLRMSHPSHPCASSALQYLRSLQRLPTGLLDLENVPRLQVVRMSLQATELLLDNGDQASAMSIMTLLKDNFAQELGLQTENAQSFPSKEGDKQAEESNLRLLEALSVY